MREIRFRVWNEKEMLQVFCIDQTKSGSSEEYYQGCMGYPNYDGGRTVKFRFDEVVWMQYTGLKDKNGKEIYEGDILQNGWTIFWREDYPNYGFYQKSKSGWCTGLGIGRKNFKYGFKWNMENPYRMERNDLEIIGNIYENPELLSAPIR